MTVTWNSEGPSLSDLIWNDVSDITAYAEKALLSISDPVSRLIDGAAWHRFEGWVGNGYNIIKRKFSVLNNYF